MRSFHVFSESDKWRALRVRVLGVLQKIGVLGVLHKIACLVCLKLMKCFLDVFDQGALVNCGLC